MKKVIPLRFVIMVSTLGVTHTIISTSTGRCAPVGTCTRADNGHAIKRHNRCCYTIAVLPRNHARDSRVQNETDNRGLLLVHLQPLIKAYAPIFNENTGQKQSQSKKPLSKINQETGSTPGVTDGSRWQAQFWSTQ